MAGDRIRIDDLPTTLYPSLEHFVAAMKDGDTVRLSVEQLLSLYAPPTSPTLDAPTIQNVLTLADAAKFRRWDVTNADIDGLIPGAQLGTLLEGAPGRHLTLGVQSGAADTGLYVLDKGNAGTPASAAYVNALLALSRNSFKYLGNDIWHAGNWARGEELVSRGVIAASSPNLELTLPATYRAFRLMLRGLRPSATTTGYLVTQLSVNGAWKTTSGQYGWVNHFVTTAGNHNYWGSGSFSFAMGLNNGGTSGVGGGTETSNDFDLFINPGVLAVRPPIVHHIGATWDSGAGNFVTGSGAGYYGGNGRADGIRVLFSAGVYGAGEYELYGQR